MRKAVVEIRTGIVKNTILIDPDDRGGFDHWTCPEGCELQPAIGDADGSKGWTWDGSRFLPPTPEPLSRIQELLRSRATTVVDGMDVLKTEQALQSERVELLSLLLDKLHQDPDSLTDQEFRKIAQLERGPVA